MCVDSNPEVYGSHTGGRDGNSDSVSIPKITQIGRNFGLERFLILFLHLMRNGKSDEATFRKGVNSGNDSRDIVGHFTGAKGRTDTSVPGPTPTTGHPSWVSDPPRSQECSCEEGNEHSV